MGRVFRAWDIRLDRPVALKVLARQQAFDRDTVQRFHNEGRSAAKLNHEGIAQVYYLGEEQGLPFIAFEFVEGTNIRDLMRQRGPLPLHEALHYTIEVAEAIAHAASRQVVHRDIKPSNIIVTSQGRTKLIDLGLARLRAVEGQGDLTATGVTLGTFDYIAPEQARDPRNADELSDIYSLGCTFFFMLTGQPPYPEGTVLQKLLQHQGDEPPDVRQFRPELPIEVAMVLRKMMAKDRRRRYQSARDLSVALRGLAAMIGVNPAGWTPSDQPSSSRRLRYLVGRHGPWLSAVAGLVAAVTLLGTLWNPPAAERNLVPPGWAAIAEESTELPTLPSEAVGGNTTQPGTQRAEDPGLVAERASPTPASARQAGGAGTSPAQPGDSQASVQPPPARTASAGQPALWDRQKPAGLSLEAGAAALRLELAGGVALGNEAALAGPPVPVQLGMDGGAQTPSTAAAGASGGRTTPPVGRTPLVVGEGRPDETVFATLDEACRAARDGDVIELRFTGLRQHETMVLDRLRLTIRAGQGYFPVVALRSPQTAAAPETVRFPSESLFALHDGELVLENVALQLDRPSESATSRRELLRLTGDCRLTLRQCWMTLGGDARSATSGDVAAAIRVAGRPTAASASPPAASGSHADIVLRNSVCRGRGSFLCLHGAAAVSCEWENGLAAMSQSLLLAQADGQPIPPEASVRLETSRLTVLVGGPLCQLVGSRDRSIGLPVQLRPSACVFAGSGGRPLIEQVDAARNLAAAAPIAWTGQDNVIAGFGDFYSVRDPDSNIPWQVKTFDDWQLLIGTSAVERRQPLSEPWSQLIGSTDRFPSLAPADLVPLQVFWQAAEQVGATLPGFVFDNLPPAPPEK